MKESVCFTEHIKPYLTSLDARIVKHHGGLFSEAGVSDMLVCWKGFFVALELKQRGEEPRPNQLAFLRSIKKAGGKAGVIYTDTWKADIDKILYEFEEYS